ncbi:MAG TPA: hypothetical protein VN181_15290 [Thermoanaerobaculia bacterium]|nr:hypothetical protein [Thermoanaerobaculia bacterium]
MRSRLLILLLLVACSSAPPAKKQVEAKGETTPGRRGYSSFGGDSPVGVIPDAVLHDAQRNKDLHLSIDYPTKAGSYPVIVFSHAVGSSQRGYVGLSAQWASYGYIVIRPWHADAATTAIVNDAVEDWTKQTADDLRNRVRDMTLVLDSLGELESKYPELEKKLDREKIGVGGHAYGALTALVIGGMRTFPAGQATSYADPRVKAVLAMSPQGTNASKGITRDSWATIKVPVLYMTGSNDNGTEENETPAWRHEAFESSPAGDKWFVSLADARQMTFAGRFGISDQEARRRADASGPAVNPAPRDPRDPRDPGVDPSQAQMRNRSRGSALSSFDRDRNIFNVVKATTTAFFDAYLRNEKAAKDYLDKLGQRTDLTVEKK